ncbi:MAG: hypothetical protein US81_C0003G0016 [Parcubacteria group bacterium GW2011_GWE2_38_18]|nr:MAG: hypothetical protein US81_C0003G0016 [Parcubacteria group bacterium GW2011_GWE2_38_18]
MNRKFGWYLRDTNKGDKKEIDWLLKEVIEIANVIASNILTLKNKNNLIFNFYLSFCIFIFKF